MNYDTFVKEGEHLQTLLKLTKLTKKERTSSRGDLVHLLDRFIFYSISTSLPSIQQNFEHNTMTGRNTFELILFAFSNRICPKLFIEYLYTFILNTPSKTRKRPNQIHWIVTNINTHQHKSYYFDMYHRSFLLLNGLKKN